MKKCNISLIVLTMLVFLIGGFTSTTQAQDEGESSPLSVGADIVSRYIWRGINLGGSSPHIQPYLEYSIGETGLAIGAWGSYSIGAGAGGSEADLYISYTPIEMITIGINDYFFPTDAAWSRDGGYFNYDDETTGHTFEAMLSFNGTESIPLSVTFAMNFYGADGVDEKGDKYLAKYLELGYSGDVKGVGISAFMGFALDDPKEEDGAPLGWYNNRSAGVINLGVTLSKDIQITEKFALPVSGSLIFNPEADEIYMVFGISL